MRMRRLYAVVRSWLTRTFGKDRDPYAIMIKMQEEMNELNMAVQKHTNWSTSENRKKVQSEMADIMILLINLADTLDMCYDSFVDSIYIKQIENQKRTWIRKADGTFKHSAEQNNE